MKKMYSSILCKPTTADRYKPKGILKELYISKHKTHENGEKVTSWIKSDEPHPEHCPELCLSVPTAESLMIGMNLRSSELLLLTANPYDNGLAVCIASCYTQGKASILDCALVPVPPHCL